MMTFGGVRNAQGASRKNLLISEISRDDLREVKADQLAAEFLIPIRYDADIRRFGRNEETVDLAGGFGEIFHH